MNTISYSKILTAVMYLLCSSLSWGQSSGTIDGKTITSKTNCADLFSADSEKANRAKCSTMRDQFAQEESDKREARTDSRSDMNTCKADFDKYQEAASDGERACKSFTGDKKDETCEKKVSNCEAKIAKGTATGNNPMFQADDEDSYKVFKDLASYSILKNMGVDPTQAMANPSLAACVKTIDPEKRANRRKELERSRRDILDKIKKQKDDIVKENEEEDKEKAKVDEELQKIDEDAKEAERTRATKQREAEAKASQESIKAQQRRRDIEKQLRLKKQEQSKKQFIQATDESNSTDAKINKQCQDQMNSLKVQIVASANVAPPANASADEKKTYEAIASAVAQIKAKGAGGSAELRKMLVAARKSCLERLNVERNAKKMQTSHELANIQEEINEAKKMVEDLNKSLTLDTENAAKVKQEADKAAADGNEVVAQKKNNLSKKLENLAKTKAQRIQAANETIQEAQAELNELVLNSTNDDIEIAYKEASTAISKTSKTRSIAENTCGCDKKGNSTNEEIQKKYADVCKILVSDDQKFKTGKTTIKATK